MADDIWREYRVFTLSCNRQSKCTELVRLFRPIVFILWVSTILLNVHHVSSSQIKITNGPSTEFEAYSIVKPKVYHARQKREILDTRINNFNHVDVLSIVLEINGAPQILDLQLNKDLIPVGYMQRRLYNGSFHTTVLEKTDLCQYKGSIRNIRDSWVAVSTCQGIRGVIYDGKNLYHIHPPDEDSSLENTHYVYRQSDLIKNTTCGFDGATSHNIIENNEIRVRNKRAIEVIHGPYNANRQSRYVELVLVIDKKEYIALGENIDKVHHHCKDIANIINALYTPLNIFVALVGVEVWTDKDAITLSPKGDTTLANFLRYRKEILVKEIPNDNAQLLTRIHFEDGVVGKALKGPICTHQFSGGVSMDHSNVIGLVAATVAHEMGHNFGMEHDSTNCICPEDRCIMASSSGSTGPTHWSSCSLEYLALAFEHGMDYCLRNKPKKLFDSPACGNGFVESGEQCDCGLEENCDNSCCNATTCMLYSNASCATGECCDLKTCKPKSAGTQCRTAEHECDLPEYCTGQSEYCPKDVFKIDGEVCNMGKAFCYQGTCRTHNDQCKLLWGPSGFSSDAQCYNMNSKGTKHGNCGYNRLNSSYIKCNDENILCGMLHCKHLNERLEFGMDSVAILSHSFINNGGKIIACRSAIVDLGLNEVDPGLAPDGAKCAPGKMCINQRCMPIDNLRSNAGDGLSGGCSKDCSGNGVCNSLGHCHCNRGFRPPDCIQPGYGGSDDSGPAEDPNGRNDFVIALYIVFLGIVPTIALIFIAIWYRKNNSTHHNTWKKESIATHDRGFSIKTIDRPGGGHQHHTARIIETIDSTLDQDPACTSLLPKANNDKQFNNDLFGKFKGFTLSPLSSVKSSTHNSVISIEKDVVEPMSTTAAAVSNLRSSIIVMKNNKKSLEQNSNTSESAFMLQPSSSITLNSEKEPDDELKSSYLPAAAAAAALPSSNFRCIKKSSISSPILATTTCTSLEFVDAKIPTRPAPDIPMRLSSNNTISNKKPSIINNFDDHLEHNNVDKFKDKEKQSEKSTTLNRITSLLKPTGGGVKKFNIVKCEEINSSPRNHGCQKASKVIDKEILRNLEISNPILQNQIETIAPLNPSTAKLLSPINVSNEFASRKNIVTRAQSLKSPDITTKPFVQTFGSMRQFNNRKSFQKRPISNPVNMRPTSPPPPIPPPPISATNSPFIDEKNNKIPGLPGYQNPPTKNHKKKMPADNTYDDCMNLIEESSLNKISEELSKIDNIYDVIEDPISNTVVNNECEISSTPLPSPPPHIDIKKINAKYCNSKESESTMGLLSEIVSEISSRNFDSIYSASTSNLIREKPNEVDKIIEEKIKSLKSMDLHNTDSNITDYKAQTSIYANSTSENFDSTASETSSGYLLPSAVNIPKTKGFLSEENIPSMTLNRSEKFISTSSSSSDKRTLKNARDEKEIIILEAESRKNMRSITKNVNVIFTDHNKKPDIISSCSTLESINCHTLKSPDIVGNNSEGSLLDSIKLKTMKNSREMSRKINPTHVKTKIAMNDNQSNVPKNYPISEKSLDNPPPPQVSDISIVSPRRQEKNRDDVESEKSFVEKKSTSKSNVAALQLIFEENKTSSKSIPDDEINM